MSSSLYEHVEWTRINETPYRYPELTDPKSIRILLLTGGDAKTLFAELIEKTSGEDFSYEAISYVWGSATKSHSLALRGGMSLKITESLYNALQSIRHSKVEDGARALWADGVCINQEDLAERSEQVKLMAEIYRSASRVITYIGEDIANVKRGIDLAKKLVECSKELDTNISPAVGSRVYRKYDIPDRYDPAWESLRDFLHRPWYTRIWIVQESLQNNKMLMMCGKTCMPWEIFTQLNKVMEQGAYNQFTAIHPHSERQVGAMGHMARLRTEYRHRPISLLELLASSRDLDCSDPRDRVFALASLLKDGEIDIDYTKSAVCIFVETASALLSSHGPMVFSYAGINRNLSVPSWVPDWSMPMQQIPVVQCRMFNASRGTSPRINFISGSLQLSGKNYDKIVHVTDTLRRVFVTARMARFGWARDQYLRISSSESAYPGGGSYLDAFWRTIISDLDPEARSRESIYAPASLAQDFEAYVRPDKARAKMEATKALPIRDTLNLDPMVIAAWEYERDMDASILDDGNKESIFSSLRGCDALSPERGGNRYRDVILRAGNLYRKLFTTEKGYIGLSVEEIAIGDVVAFFAGGKVPFVLRSSGNVSEYLVVGDCYVHGLMNGEAFRRGRGDTTILTLV
jgi:hypothetical protein